VLWKSQSMSPIASRRRLAGSGNAARVWRDPFWIANCFHLQNVVLLLGAFINWSCPIFEPSRPGLRPIPTCFACQFRWSRCTVLFFWEARWLLPRHLAGSQYEAGVLNLDAVIPARARGASFGACYRGYCISVPSARCGRRNASGTSLVKPTSQWCDRQ